MFPKGLRYCVFGYALQQFDHPDRHGLNEYPHRSVGYHKSAFLSEFHWDSYQMKCQKLSVPVDRACLTWACFQNCVRKYDFPNSLKQVHDYFEPGVHGFPGRAGIPVPSGLPDFPVARSQIISVPGVPVFWELPGWGRNVLKVVLPGWAVLQKQGLILRWEARSDYHPKPDY